ncbi:MAG: exodeoxyribonuclease VII small subunit [Alphaproteobacteria bacterium]|nr:exodeoxyribonuclease VII small subunit [Alphaproteobacteria bacterium]
MSENGVPDDIEKLSFEEALTELEKIVRDLESGQGALDDAISAYERGALLKKHCETQLAEAKTRVEKISFSQNGEAGVEPASIG